MDGKTVRPDLPPLPTRMVFLQVNEAGYPVPYFVAWPNGTPDFRIVDPVKLSNCMQFRLCWLCGQPLGRYVTYVIGPMCAVNRVSSEPPSHTECADFAARACPFLTRPNAPRREGNKPDGLVEPAGVTIARNPGVALVWTTTRITRFVAPPTPQAPAGGFLWDIGEPHEIKWYAEGRPATREEVLASVASGLPILQAMADKEGPLAHADLAEKVKRAEALFPA